MSSPTAPRTVQCYHCSRMFDVPPRAMSISCPWCYKRVTLDDLVIKDYCLASRLQTCGRISVHKRGVLISSLIEAREGIEILGRVEGKVISGGRVIIGPRARVIGDLAAPSIFIEKGATLEGGYFKIDGAPSRMDGEDVRCGIESPASDQSATPPLPVVHTTIAARHSAAAP